MTSEAPRERWGPMKWLPWRQALQPVPFEANTATSSMRAGSGVPQRHGDSVGPLNVAFSFQPPVSKRPRAECPEGAQVLLLGLGLREIPRNILENHTTVRLDLAHNGITNFTSFRAFIELSNLPTDLIALRRLWKLGCGWNQLTEIPEVVGQLSNLTWLDFTHNRISKISDNLGDLSKLATLGLSECLLTVLPECIGRLKNLVKVAAYGNQLTTLPACIGQLTNLQKLDMSNNRLRFLPKEIGLLVNLSWLNLR